VLQLGIGAMCLKACLISTVNRQELIPIIFYGDFRKKMMKDGFTMFQFSAYLRHCSSRENSEVHLKRIKKNLPPRGHVGILSITDKQFGMMEIFYGKTEQEKAPIPEQLKLF